MKRFKREHITVFWVVLMNNQMTPCLNYLRIENFFYKICWDIKALTEIHFD